MTRIEIDRLEIRLRNSSPELARSLTEGLGNLLLEQLEGSAGILGGDSSISLDHVDAGTVTGTGSMSARELQGEIARAIAGTVTSKMDERKGNRMSAIVRDGNSRGEFARDGNSRGEFSRVRNPMGKIARDGSSSNGIGRRGSFGSGVESRGNTVRDTVRETEP